MNWYSRLSVVLVALCLPVSIAGGGTIYVAADAAPGGDGSSWAAAFDTIQAGIDAAVAGDTVLVADGTYTGDGNRDLDFGGKAITVRSDGGDPAFCVIDCEADWMTPHRGFYFHSGETAASAVQGVTVRGGYAADGGGGVRCSGSSPTFTDCTITQNGTDDEGGGVCCVGSNPTLINCAITQNMAYSEGGGIYSEESSPTLTNCTITENGVSGTYAYGGGICCTDDSIPMLTNCTIRGNNANGTYANGGGIYCIYRSSPTLMNCTICGNSAISEASSCGGGVYCKSSSSPTLINCRICGNVVISDAACNGGGFYSSGGSPTLIDCRITENTADWNGGGACYYYSSPTLVNCTIAENTAGFGGGVFCSSSSPTLANCILWDDVPEEIYLYSGATATVTYCDIQGGWTGEGNIDAVPLFVDPDGPDDDPATWEDNDYHLAVGSPCIDAGDPGFVPLPSETDMDGDPRVWDGDGNGEAIVDMGVDEFRLIADLNCDGAIDGFDVDPFVMALTTPIQYLEQYPDCDPRLADCNGDGALNAFDIDPFVLLLTGG